MKDLSVLYFVFWLLCFFATLVQMGYYFGQPFSLLYQLTFKHIFEFLCGICLGCLWLRSIKIPDYNNYFLDLFDKIGLSIGILGLALIFVFCDIRDNTENDYWTYDFDFTSRFIQTSSANGLLTPLFSLIIWTLANDKDVFIKPLLTSKILNFLGHYSYQIYILQALAFQIGIYFNIRKYFLLILIALSIGVYHFVEVPFFTVLMFIYGKIGTEPNKLYNKLLLFIYDSHFTWLAVIKYYVSMVIII